MLLIAYLTQILEINNNFSLTLISGADDNKFVYNINNIIQNLGSRKCTAMLFLHAFIGSDYTSSFHGAGNLKWFDVCYKTEKYDEIFISDEDFLKIIEFTVDEYGIQVATPTTWHCTDTTRSKILLLILSKSYLHHGVHCNYIQ